MITATFIGNIVKATAEKRDSFLVLPRKITLVQAAIEAITITKRTSTIPFVEELICSISLVINQAVTE